MSAQLHLLQTADCKVLITPVQRPPAISAIVSAQKKELRVLEIPTVDELLNTHARHFPYNKSFDQARQDPLTVMHTSGSTGFPKPITWTHDFAAAYAKQLQLDPPPGFESIDKLYEGNRVFVMFPPFHVSHLTSRLDPTTDPYPGGLCSTRFGKRNHQPDCYDIPARSFDSISQVLVRSVEKHKGRCRVCCTVNNRRDEQVTGSS